MVRVEFGVAAVYLHPLGGAVPVLRLLGVVMLVLRLLGVVMPVLRLLGVVMPVQCLLAEATLVLLRLLRVVMPVLRLLTEAILAKLPPEAAMPEAALIGRLVEPPFGQVGHPNQELAVHHHRQLRPAGLQRMPW